MKSILLIFFLSMLSAESYGQITFSSNFDNGSLDSAIQSGNIYSVYPNTSLHFRISGTAGLTPIFRSYQGSQFIFRNAHRMVYRSAGDTAWKYFDTGYVSSQYYYFYNNTPFTSDSLYIAFWYPWTFGDMNSFMTSIQNSPYVKNSHIRGYSLQGRPVYGFHITDTTAPAVNKKKIILISRQHMTEQHSSNVLIGLCEYLVNSNDPVASDLRRRAIFYIYPMVDPDGVFLGKAYAPDPNRSWRSDTLPSGRIEIDTLRKVIYRETGGSADFGIDIHSNSYHQGDYYWWGMMSAPEPFPAYSNELARRIRKADSTDNNGISVIEGRVSQDAFPLTGLTAGRWMFNVLNAVSYTFEPGGSPPLSRPRVKAVGISIAKGIYDMIVNYLPTVIINNNNRVYSFHLHQNYPNPFNPLTLITFDVPENSDVSLVIYDHLGREVSKLVSSILTKGSYTYTWDAADRSSGVYYARFTARGERGSTYSDSKKLLLIK